MRPVNLIPVEERRDGHGPMRTGPVPYLLVGALVAVLAGVTALVVIGNQISDRKSEVAKLEREDAVAGARAQRLAAYTQFRGLREKRVQTVTSLADSRFDWERVMRELSLVLPSDVWLTSLEASAAPGSGAGGGSGGGGGLSGSIKGPSLTISGCATGHEAVAGFVTALKEIAGVTRVGVESSELGSESSSGSSGGSGGSSEGGSAGGCQVRPSFATFNMVVAFDAAPVPQLESAGEAPASAPEQAQAASSATSSSESSSGSSSESSGSSSSSSSEGGG